MVDADTLLYKWSYDQFLPLEIYVMFQNDRQLWVHRQQEVDDKLKKGMQ